MARNCGDSVAPNLYDVTGARGAVVDRAGWCGEARHGDDTQARRPAQGTVRGNYCAELRNIARMTIVVLNG